MKFKKPIVSAGVYAIPTAAGPRMETITEDRLRKWAESFKAMREKGLRVPAPWTHDDKASPVVVGSDGTLPQSDKNGGFWEKLWVEDQEGVPTLFGELDAPGSAEDMSTPAGKIGKTVQETSIYVRPEFMDGKGNKWQDALMHIALVTHPVEPGQKNFEQVTEGLALSMAMQTHTMSKNPDYKGVDESQNNSGRDQPSDNGTGSVSNIKTLIDTLKRVAKIVLPDDTDESCLSERLLGALLQKEISETPEVDGPDTTKRKDPQLNTTKKPPEGAKLKTAPIIMALSETQIKAIVDSKVVNPVTGKPFDAAELNPVETPVEIDDDTIMSHPAFAAQVSANKALLGVLSAQKLGTLVSRIDSLIRAGKITKDYADKRLKPQLEGFQMSFGSDGKPQAHPVELILEGLESSPILSRSAGSGKMSASTHLLGNLGDTNQILNALAMNLGGDLDGLRVEPQPSAPALMSDEEADKAAKEFLGIS